MTRFLFGSLHFDSSDRLLYKGAELVELPARTGDVLLVLLENAGKVVLRETLRQAVWGGTFTEDDNLSKHVSILRNILKLHMGETEVIRTLPKRGYQFVSPVRLASPLKVVGAGSGIVPHSSELRVWKSLNPPGPLLVSNPQHDKPENLADNSNDAIAIKVQKPLTLWMLTFLAAVIALASALIALHKYKIGGSRSSPPTVAILSPKNLSDNPDQDWFGLAIQELIASNLAKDEGGTLVAGDTTDQAEIELGIDKMRTVDDNAAQHFARQVECDMVVTGSYLPEGNTLRFDLQLREGRTGRVIGEVSRVAPLDSVLSNVTEAAYSFRLLLNPAKVGNTSSAIGGLPTQPTDRMLPYRTGSQLIAKGNPLSARPYLYEAALLNPSSALVHSALATDWSLLGYSRRSLSEAHLVLQMVSSLPDDQKLAVKANAYAIAHDWPNAKTAYINLRRLDPSNVDFVVGLANVRIRSNEAETAMDELKAFTASSPTARANPQISLVEAQASASLANWREELFYAGQALGEARLIGSSFLEIRALQREANAWRNLGNTPAFVSDYLRMKTLSLNTGDSQGLGVALIFEAETQLKNDDPTCVQTYHRALAIEERLGDDLNAASALTNLGVYFFNHGDLAAARDSYQQAVPLAYRGGYPLWAVYALSNMAAADAAMDRLDEALKELRNTVSLAQSLHYTDGTTQCQMSIGNLEMLTGDLAAARTESEQAIKSATKVGNMPQVAIAKRVLALIEMSSGNLVRARQLLNDALALHVLSGPDLTDLEQSNAALELEERHAAPVTESMTRLALASKTTKQGEEAWRLVAESWLSRGNLTEARSAINRALELANKSPDTHDYLIPSSITEARIDAASGDRAKALKSLSRLLTRAEQIHDVSLELQIRLRQGEIQQLQDRTSADFNQSNRTLEALYSDATKQGFKLIARKAHILLDAR